MEGNPLREVTARCLAIDRLAGELYRGLAEAAWSADLRDLWERMAADEARHERYWKELVLASAQETPPISVDDPERVLRELAEVETELAEALGRGPADDGREGLLLACRIERHLLHPVITALLFFARDELGLRSFEADYAAHLQALGDAVRARAHRYPALRLAADLLERLWREDSVLARQSRRIRTLKGLIPICSSCKRIRNDRGFWQHLESYLQEHAEADFTHGLCPQCLTSLYNEPTPS